MTEVTDQELIAGIAAQDAEALRALYHRHNARVYNTALSYLQDTSDAEEVTQDVFAKAWRAAATFKSESQVTTWLYRITVNTALTALDKRRRQRGIFGALSATRDPPDFYHPGVQLEERETSRALFAAIYRLPPRQKTAFVLSYVEELPRQQVAEVMELTLKAIEGLLMRAKKSLKTYLHAEYPHRG
ncbi:RNA polymerase sigma-70 factor (ECF subfamily) [Lewinella aquimaris]|uniref:RNA polymerase sigma factor n=1 Tax=Neolewinella aquimaris TaxID=1835722 RepID=A0A840E231_9BACT|nr:RNA polymerase sigma factor [Neolewinella aquimaris]MBB4079624.1 RNA polymerase sigma-70 factor (ECF subfamily) [Neolewinella aquimaris]